MGKEFYNWQEDNVSCLFYEDVDAEQLMANEIYKKYSKEIDKIYNKIYKQIKKNPNKRLYYVDVNKYNEDTIISLRNFFKYTFKVQNNEPIDCDAYETYVLTTNARSAINSVTLSDYTTYTTVNPKGTIKKPVSFYIYW